jgi:hypothetical protein
MDPPTPILVCRPVHVVGAREVLGTIWPGWLRPSSPTARLTHMDPAILVIPTFGTYQAYTPLGAPKPRGIPEILMSWLARMIHLRPVGPIIGLVGIFGRDDV